MENLNATLLPIVQKINGYLADYILIFLLLGAGLWFTIKTGFAQRYLGQGLKSIFGGLKLAMNATNISSVMHIPFKFLYSVLPVSGIFIVVARVLKYIRLLTEKNPGKVVLL